MNSESKKNGPALDADVENIPAGPLTAPPAPLLVPLKSSAYAKKRMAFAAMVAAQIALIGSVAWAPAATLIKGKEITLQTQPVDPCDMFRGDYVHLSYEINRQLPSPPPEDSSTVYTALYKQGAYWHPRLTSTQRPTLRPGEVCIKGKYQAWLTQVNYGIEQVFVPEKTGHKAETARHLQVVAAVDEDGNAVIKRVDNGAENLYDAGRVITGAR